MITFKFTTAIVSLFVASISLNLSANSNIEELEKIQKSIENYDESVFEVRLFGDSLLIPSKYALTKFKNNEVKLMSYSDGGTIAIGNGKGKAEVYEQLLELLGYSEKKQFNCFGYKQTLTKHEDKGYYLFMTDGDNYFFMNERNPLLFNIVVGVFLSKQKLTNEPLCLIQFQ